MSKLLGNRLLLALRTPLGAAGTHGTSRIGAREVVGYGVNGACNYVDRSDFPMPAIRFREDTPDIKALREKEKGAWNALSLEEKKVLYRASFCQTFAEFEAPTGEWKGIFGYAIGILSLSIWMFMGLKLFVYPPLTITFDEEHQKAQLKRMLDLEVNPILGLSSKWDYENNRWK